MFCSNLTTNLTPYCDSKVSPLAKYLSLALQTDMDTHGVPHPLLKEPSLFMAGAPKRITWKMIIQAFSACGTVLSAGKYNGLRDANTWIIRYSSILEGVLHRACFLKHKAHGLHSQLKWRWLC